LASVVQDGRHGPRPDLRAADDARIARADVLDAHGTFGRRHRPVAELIHAP